MELAGERLGPYQVDEALGSGGMGTVYRATDADGRFVALKMLHPHLLAAKGAFKRFLREAELGRQIAHPNVVRTLDVDARMVRGNQVNFLVLEFVEGQTLDALLAELGAVPEELCRHIGRQVADALTAIHATGAIHRDLKPANIIITPDNEVKVMDLGVAMLVEEAMRLTDPGEFLGSVLYAAPEQWNPDARPDGRIDLFALGTVLYELSTGRHPFASHNKSVPVSMLTSRRPDPASATNPELSDFFVELVAKLMEADADARFASAQLTYGILDAGERSAWWQRRHVELDRAGRTRARQIHVPRDAGVYGRDAELGLLREKMERVRDGQGQVILLEGESGIGKTRLVDEFLRLDEGPLQLLFGSYPPGGAATAEGAFSSAFREHFGGVDLETKLGPVLPGLPGLVPAFAALLRGEPPPDENSKLSADAIATVFTETTCGLAQREPVVLFLDDLHFAPREARLLFVRVAQAIADQPVLLIGAYRPDAAGEWSAGLLSLEQVARLQLPRLGPGDLSKLLADALDSHALADQLGWEIARKSDGNPFFVFEILRDLRERKQLVRGEDGTWKTTGIIRQIDTPHSVRDLIHARLRKLEDEDRDLLDVAACCGYRFDPAIVADACGVDLIPALKRFRHLERDRSLIRPDGREYIFDHHQMQEAIYADLFEQLREQYHAALGDACERAWSEPTEPQAVTIAEHFLKGGAAERAEPHITRAIAHLNAGNLYESAGALAKLALDAGVPTDPEARFTVMNCATTAANMTGDWEAEARFAEELQAAAGNDEQRAAALLRLGNHLYSISEFEKSIERYGEARDLAARTGDGIVLEAAERGIGINYSRMGRREEALAHHFTSLELCRKNGVKSAEAAAHVNIGIQCVDLERPEEAEKHYARAVELARETGELRWEGNASANWGRIHFERGHYHRAFECASRFREITRQIGDRRGESASGIMLTTLWTLFGAIEEMEHELARVDVAVEETRDLWLKGYSTRQRGWIAEQREDWEEAVRRYQESVDIRRELGDEDSLPDSLLELGTAHVHAGRIEEGRAYMTESLALQEARGVNTAYTLCELSVLEPERIDAARKALANDDSRGALRVIGPFALWRAGGDPKDLEAAYAALLELESRIPLEYQRASTERVWKFRAVKEEWGKLRR
ncbi:MAG: serine/threonine-protein kinase [Planctomycetota bacterium]|jgi:tetratricopeptide (TPR) repeat protein